MHGHGPNKGQRQCNRLKLHAKCLYVYVYPTSYVPYLIFVLRKGPHARHENKKRPNAQVQSQSKPNLKSQYQTKREDVVESLIKHPVTPIAIRS